MKKIICYFCVSVLCACILSACSSAKKTVASQQEPNPYGTVVVQDECEKLTEEKPEVRQFGMGTHFKRATADNIAALLVYYLCVVGARAFR